MLLFAYKKICESFVYLCFLAYLALQCREMYIILR